MTFHADVGPPVASRVPMIEDGRLLVLLQTLSGLRLEPAEIYRILAAEGINAKDLIDSLQNAEAKDYFKSTPQWLGEARRTLDESHEKGVRWCLRGDDDYPGAWLNLSHAPALFSYRGRPCWRTYPMLAIVGSRTPMAETRYWMQRELAQFLKANAFGVVSGGARGIDQFAHRLAVDYRRPTVCILPTGVLNPYPFGEENLWERILAEGGCLLSTFSLREPLRKWAFHVRNRWIAGLAPACFVVEANRRSGSTLTASLALEEGRQVCTLPVFPLGQQGLANLDLIQSGAQLVRDHIDLKVFCDGAKFPMPNFALAPEPQHPEKFHSPAIN